MNLPANITSTMAVQVFSDCIDLYNNILQYRVVTIQLQNQREQMHREANAIEMQLKADLQKELAYIQALASGFNFTLQQLGNKPLNIASTLQKLEEKEHKLWEVYYLASSKEDKTFALNMLEKLSEQRSALMKEYLKSDDYATLQAFNIFATNLSRQHFGGTVIDV